MRPIILVIVLTQLLETDLKPCRPKVLPKRTVNIHNHFIFLGDIFPELDEFVNNVEYYEKKFIKGFEREIRDQYQDCEEELIPTSSTVSRTQKKDYIVRHTELNIEKATTPWRLEDTHPNESKVEEVTPPFQAVKSPHSENPFNVPHGKRDDETKGREVSTLPPQIESSPKESQEITTPLSVKENPPNEREESKFEALTTALPVEQSSSEETNNNHSKDVKVTTSAPEENTSPSQKEDNYFSNEKEYHNSKDTTATTEKDSDKRRSEEFYSASVADSSEDKTLMTHEQEYCDTYEILDDLTIAENDTRDDPNWQQHDQYEMCCECEQLSSENTSTLSGEISTLSEELLLRSDETPLWSDYPSSRSSDTSREPEVTATQSKGDKLYMETENDQVATSEENFITQEENENIFPTNRPYLKPKEVKEGNKMSTVNEYQTSFKTTESNEQENIISPQQNLTLFETTAVTEEDEIPSAKENLTKVNKDTSTTAIEISRTPSEETTTIQAYHMSFETTTQNIRNEMTTIQEDQMEFEITKEITTLQENPVSFETTTKLNLEIEVTVSEMNQTTPFKTTKQNMEEEMTTVQEEQWSNSPTASEDNFTDMRTIQEITSENYPEFASTEAESREGLHSESVEGTTTIKPEDVISVEAVWKRIVHGTIANDTLDDLR